MRLATRGRVWTGAIFTLLLLRLSAPRGIATGENVPAKFDPDLRTTTLGLAIKF